MGMKRTSILKDVLITQPDSSIPSIPSLPVTSVNPQPRNEASPVAPAGKVVRPLERAGDDKGFGENKVKPRDRAIETQAILKSTLESPFLAQLTMGQNKVEATETLKYVFSFALKLYDEAK